MRAQALVEFALVLPVLMLVLLGFGEVGFLMSAQHGWQRSADSVADAVAAGLAAPELAALVAAERTRTGCASDPVVTFPDGTDPGARVLVGWTCWYQPRLTRLFDGLPVTVESVAVLPGAPSPSSAPSSAPSGSVAP